MAVVLALIVYGSAFPFDYVAHRASLDDLRLLARWPDEVSVVDAVGNALLFLPFGLLVPALARQRAAQVAWLAAGCGLAWMLQFGQFWFPARDPSGSDAWFNCAGVLAGWLAGHAIRWLHQRHAARLAAQPADWPVAALLALAWIVYRWFPLWPALDLQNYRHGWGPVFENPRISWPQVLFEGAGWLLWFRAVRHAFWPAARAPALGLAVLLVLVTEPVFPYSYLSVSALLGAAGALAVLLVWDAGGRRHAALPLAAVVALALVASGLHAAPSPWWQGGAFIWLPFAGLLEGNMYGNTASLVAKSFAYGGLLWLLADLGLRWRTAALLVAGLLGWIEWSQLRIPGRTAEVTDPLLALLLALVLRTLQRLARRGG